MRRPNERRTPYWAAAGCVLSIVAALLFHAAPTRLIEGLSIMPSWPLMVIFLWSGMRPYFMPPFAVFLIGLTQDLLTGAPMGVWALSYLVSISVFRFRGEEGMPRDLPPIVLRFSGTLLLAHTIAYLAGSVLPGNPANLQPLIIEAVASILMFPLLAFLVVRNRRSSRSGFIGG